MYEYAEKELIMYSLHISRTNEDQYIQSSPLLVQRHVTAPIRNHLTHHHLQRGPGDNAPNGLREDTRFSRHCLL